MYTKLDDMKMAQKILAYLDQHPNAILKDIIKHNFTNHKRIKKLQSDGYLTLPLPMERAVRNKAYWEKIKNSQAV
jgi:hypothetical protein